MNTKINPCKVVTGTEVKWNYVNMLEPKAFGSSAPKYSVQLIIPKTDIATVTAIQKAILAAYEEGSDKLAGDNVVTPPIDAIRTPLRDGDEEHTDSEQYRGCYFMNASNKSKPKFVDKDKHPITSAPNIGSFNGASGKAALTMFAYNYNGNAGIACRLDGLQMYQS